MEVGQGPNWGCNASEKKRRFENRMPRRIYEPKKERERERNEIGLIEGWRKLHNYELHNLYLSENVF
jgi:hypothetical protein